MQKSFRTACAAEAIALAVKNYPEMSVDGSFFVKEALEKAEK